MTTEPEQALSALSVGLSPEEVLCLLNHLEAPDLPGVDRESFNALEPAQQQMALDVARRGLLARELLLPENDALNVNPLLLSMLVPNLVPEHSLLLWQQDDGNPGRMYYGHSWEDVHVLRWLSRLGIHQFLLLSSKEALAKAVVDLLELEMRPSPNETMHRLPVAVFEQAQAAASAEGTAAAAERLRSGGLPQDVATLLGTALAAPRRLASIAGIHHAEEQGGVRLSVMAIETREGAWLVDYATAATDGQVSVRRGQAGEVEQRVRDFVAGY